VIDGDRWSNINIAPSGTNNHILKAPERNAGISYLRDKYVASAIGDGQRRLQMIANKNGGHIEPYLETHN
jgi:hypothetical protein